MMVYKSLSSFFILESFNTNNLHQLFDYEITFVNSRQENTNSKGDFVLKSRVQTLVLKISGIQKILLKFRMTNSINTHLRFKITS